MINLRQHTIEINKDFSALYFALYMKGEWGSDVGYTPLPPYLANMRKRLCDYQNLHADDCDDELFIASQGTIDYNCCSSGTTRVEGPIGNSCCPPGYVISSWTINTVNIYGICLPDRSVVSVTEAVPFVPCTCCPPGSTKEATSVQTNCCPLGYYWVAPGVIPAYPDGTCRAFPPILPEFAVAIPCPCCAPGYTYDSLTGFCKGGTGNVLDPIVCPERCVADGSGITVPFVACTAYCIDGAGNVTDLVGCPDPTPDSVILEYPTLDTSGCNRNIVRCWDGQC